MESQRSRGTSIASATSGRYGAIEQNIDDDQDRSLGHGTGQESMDQNRSGPFRCRGPARSVDLWIWYWINNFKNMAQDPMIPSMKSPKTFLLLMLNRAKVASDDQLFNF